MLPKHAPTALLAGLLVLISALPALAQSSDIPPPPEPSNGPALAVPESPIVTITFPNAKSVQDRSRGRQYGIVGIRPNEVVDIALEFSPQWAHRLLAIEALDGGRILAQRSATVAADGSASVRFQVGNDPGLYRLSITGAGAPALLRFWVPDPQNPRANPTVLVPER
jgi:hypothetical protein